MYQGEEQEGARMSGSEGPISDSKETRQTEPDDGRKSRQGRPRNKAVHQNILECTRDLAKQGLAYRDISFEAISREAGVAKTTLYRWWENKAELVREACFLERLTCPSTGSLLGDLEDLVRQEIAAQMNCTSRPVFAALIAELVAHAQETKIEVPCPYQLERTDMLTDIFQQAEIRGDWSGGIDVESAYETLFAMVFYPCIGRGRDYDDAGIARLAKRIAEEASLDK